MPPTHKPTHLLRPTDADDPSRGEDDDMVSQTRVEVQQAVADHLGAPLEDLVLIADSDTSYTFRQKSTGEEHTGQIEIGPEGPVVITDA
jgi:hypothetical protein